MTTLLAIAFSSYAYSFVANGIYYNINSNSNTVSVTYKDNYNSYSGSVTIPSSVSYNGKSYSVTAIGNNAFRNCNSLTKVTIPTSVTSIGNYAFYNCSGLTSQTIPTSVTSIGNYAFYNCSGLTSVTIPTSVTSIGENAFSDCTALKTLNYNAVSCGSFNIGTTHPFYNTSISNINIGSGVQKIPAYFAYNLTQITNITIPTSVTSIGNYAFYNCSGLTSVTIPTSVTSIGENAFYNCYWLTNVTIPTSITSIGNNAFSKCTALKTLNYNAVSCGSFGSGSYHPFYNTIISTINIGSSVQKIPANFAYNLTQITSIAIPTSVTSIDNYAFSGCTALKTLNYNAVSCGDFGSGTSHPFYNTIISTINIGSDVQKIPANFTYNLKQITSITIPTSVTSIGNYAFSGCTALKTLNYNAVSCGDFGSGTSHPFYNTIISTINIGSSVQKIPANFANGLTRLTSVTIPNSVYSIRTDAFIGCSGLTRVNISDLNAWCNISFSNDNSNPLYLSHHIYLNGAEIKNLVIPNTISIIKFGTFYGGSSITSVTIPDNVILINMSAFRYCSGLRSATIGNSVTTIGDYVFDGCTSLNNLTMGSSVSSIGAYAFNNCSSLPNITLPNLVTSIGNYSFQNCSNLTSITIPNSVTSIGNNAFQNCSSLSAISIGKNVSTIGSSAFSGCSPTTLTWNAKNCSSNGSMTTSKISQVTIGSNVELIPGYFVRDSKITTVTIPTSVTSIGSYAFSGCTNLSKLIWNAKNCTSNGSMATSNITQVTIGASVESLPGNFVSGSKVTSVTIPNSVTSIGTLAFQNCYSLATISIGKSVTSMGNNAFSGCSPTTLTWSAQNCNSNGGMTTSNITQMTIGSSVQVLPSSIANGSKITSITIPSSVVMIGSYAFNGCTGLKRVTIPDAVSSIENNTFRDCTGLTSITIGNSVQTISYDAFYGCTGLTSVTFPNSVTYIGGSAFSNCTNLNTISLPNSVFSVGGSVFSGCTKLAKVYCRAIMPPVIDTYYNNMFDAVTYQNAILYVPDLTYGYYIQTNPWNLFHEIKTQSYSDGSTVFNSTIYPTSIKVEDASQTANSYFTFNGQRYNQMLLVTGLEPNQIYNATYTKGGVETPFKFYTSSLMMVPEGATMLTETTALLKAETNMADEETICGFDWRRYEGPDDYLGTRVYCPVYDGQMAGTLKNLTRDTFYKFRPFYKSSNGSVHYGDWVTFYTADAGVEFDPVVYTYNYPAVTQTQATLQGVALRGSDVITQQGFEYRKATSSSRTKVTATGERMSKTVSGLQPGTKYKFRAFVTAGGKTTYGDEVDFTTLTNTVGGDANGDGVVNISDVTALISYLLGGSGSGINLSNADVNSDGDINIMDVTTLISSLLGGN